MAEKQPQKIGEAPDPEEDDLDDLDDVLDEFEATSISQPNPAAAPTTAPAASGPGRPTSSASHDVASDATEEDFAKQLQAGMSSLISELDSNPEMQAEFEKMMQELVAAGAAPSDQEAGEHIKLAAEAAPKASESSKPAAAPASAKPSAKKAGGDEFQDTIRRTMARMQASSDQASASTTSAHAQSEDDFLAQMMKEFSDGGGDGDGDFNSLLMNMMAQLTNKEILYDPMKELHDKFPAWLEQNRGKTAKDELARFEEQQRLVGEIVGRFERKGYSDGNEDDRTYIVERMQKMQEQGSPPPDLVGDMSAAQEALGDLDTSCPTQ